jgi:hypothetical protein
LLSARSEQQEDAAKSKIVMELDQHRAQSPPSGCDLETGEVSRARVSPTDRAGARRFLERFRGRPREVALEATIVPTLGIRTLFGHTAKAIAPAGSGRGRPAVVLLVRVAEDLLAICHSRREAGRLTSSSGKPRRG